MLRNSKILLSLIVLVALLTSKAFQMGAMASTCGGDSTSSAVAAKTTAAPVVNRFGSGKELADELTKRIIEISAKAIAEKGEFTVALSGGSLPNTIAPGLLAAKESIAWGKWRIYFADERYVAHEHADSNLKAAKDAFLSKVTGETQPTIIAINADVSVEDAAKEYEDKLPKAPMDLILLGMGPDGHTASLFPGHALLDEKVRKVIHIKDSPKPPPERITFTLPYINAAKNVFFVTTGASKADVVARCAIDVSKLEADPLPSARVRPTAGALEWFIDADAAAKL